MDDIKHMQHALSLGARGLGRTWPNPSVGCVIVADNLVVGRGWTQDGGRPHGEAMALAQAGDLARGATAYVTLEPCSHTGKTPPCCDALIAAGIARVVVAHGDPDVRVNGQGIAKLQDAGVEVTVGVCENAARDQLAGFLSCIQKSRPFVTLKLAMSWDGKIATSTGDSQWITGPKSRRRVHMMRATHDAVLVGAGTTRADDPQLTVRGLGLSHQPVRVVLSRDLDLPFEGKLFGSAREIPLWIIHAEDANSVRRKQCTDLGATLIEAPVVDGKIDLKVALEKLSERGLTRVFCEGGGHVAASLLADDLVDSVAVFSAGLSIGGNGISGVGDLRIENLSDATRYRPERVEIIGDDILTYWNRK